MTGQENLAAAGRDRIRAGHADREQVVEALKDAFVQGRLTRDELDARADLALAARTRAELAALTADIPDDPAVVRPAVRLAPPAATRRRRLAKAAAGSGGCLVIAFSAIWVAANILDPDGLGNPYHPWSTVCLFVALLAVATAIGIMVRGVGTSAEQRRSRSQVPPPAARRSLS